MHSDMWSDRLHTEDLHALSQDCVLRWTFLGYSYPVIWSFSAQNIHINVLIMTLHEGQIFFVIGKCQRGLECCIRNWPALGSRILDVASRERVRGSYSVKDV